MLYVTTSYKLYNLKNVKNTNGGMSLLVQFQAYFTKSSTPPWVFFTFRKLYKLYKISQRILWKLTPSYKVILETVLKKKNLSMCKQHP